MQTYLFSYRHNGHRYSFDVTARSEQEARERVGQMAWARYDGELVMRIPAVGGNWFADAVCGVRNLFNRNRPPSNPNVNANL